MGALENVTHFKLTLPFVDRSVTCLGNTAIGLEQVRVAGDVARHIVSRDHRDSESIEVQFTGHPKCRLGRTFGIGDPHVGDQPGLVRPAKRQYGPQASLQKAVVARRRVGKAVAVTIGQGAFTDTLEDNRVKPAALDQVYGGVKAGGGEPGTGADSVGSLTGHCSGSDLLAKDCCFNPPGRVSTAWAEGS